MRSKRIWPIAALGIVAFAATGYLLSESGLSPNGTAPSIDITEPASDAPPAGETLLVAAPWTCHWDPTYDDNWHDDVLCTNGLEFDRPTLRPDDDFVTEEEMLQSATEYAASLNQ
ncbi:hypothetical protein [Microbacterium sp. SD291]|uniref:hypothetical protein n=1 Tax=Microbacterium sp. SD291 TaxID=2782007 RepID=UPI001A95BC79|nr:hypothetical protein [Microbacterium sp. SD291]MBO0980866.1 hypothetical protein [Microbacterium sp. SD291]